MGYGMDESWEEDLERIPTADEQQAIDFFEYDLEEFFGLPDWEQREKIRISRARKRKG